MQKVPWKVVIQRILLILLIASATYTTWLEIWYTLPLFPIFNKKLWLQGTLKNKQHEMSQGEIQSFCYATAREEMKTTKTNLINGRLGPTSFLEKKVGSNQNDFGFFSFAHANQRRRFHYKKSV